MSSLGDLFDSSTSAHIARSDSVEPNAHTFWRVRLACRSVTVAYLVTLVLALATFKAEKEPWSILNNFATHVEFLSTGFVETAIIAELLLTLPSSDRGVPAIWHYLAYELLLMFGTAILYGPLLQSWDLIPLYGGVHLAKGFGIGFILFVARQRLRQHFFSEGGLPNVYVHTLKYMADLLKVLGLQITLCIALIASFVIEPQSDSRPNIGRLLAITLYSSMLAQSFVLTIIVRDAGTLRADRIATLDFSLVEALSMVGIAAFSAIGLFAYFLALEDGKNTVTEEMGRMLYFGAYAAYFTTAACVYCLVHQAERAALADPRLVDRNDWTRTSTEYFLRQNNTSSRSGRHTESWLRLGAL